MCGISGIITKEARKYKREIDSMTEALKHRGPDGSGTVFFNQCVFGHNRLSVVDLHTGDQPMFSISKKQCVVFNGEIYGYVSIRESLKKFYTPRTSSDTEVILALYEKYGVDFLKKLPGMFAFALWDDEEEQLICARDRFGEKPFYYAIGKNGEFIFASEIKAILATRLIRPILNKNSLVHYLRYLYVHPHHTIFENIYTLPPAHQLILKNGNISIKKYWNQPETNNALEFGNAMEEFKSLLNRSVERQLIADVPIGAFLSGGLDSSTMVAVASRYSNHIKTFSFGFEESINELPFALEIAKKYNTDHCELFDHTDIAELLIRMQDIYDEPFGDSSNIPTYLISKLARQHIKVVLTGDGGDELLGGYEWYKSYTHMKDVAKFPDVYVAHMLLKVISKTRSLYLRNLKDKYRAASDKQKYNTVSASHIHKNTYFHDDELQSFGLSKFLQRKSYPSLSFSDTVDDAMRIDIEDYMPGDILVKTDRASMANSLELRAPFLDFDLASFCITLPSRFKITKDSDKYILREAYKEAWTPSINRRTKQGFGAPVGKWLRRNSVNLLKKQYLNDSSKKIFQIIPFLATRPIIKRDNYKTWALLVLSLWMENHDFDIIS